MDKHKKIFGTDGLKLFDISAIVLFKVVLLILYKAILNGTRKVNRKSSL